MSSSLPLSLSRPPRRTGFAALFAAAAGLSSFTMPPADARDRAVPSPRVARSTLQDGDQMPTLGCCECLGGQNTLDVSTVPGVPWRVDGQPTVHVAVPNVAWSTQTNGALWISGNADAEGSSTIHQYTLAFRVEKCTIPQTIVFNGIAAAGDDTLKVFLTGPGNAGPAQCTSAGYCFATVNQLNNFATWPVTGGPGVYTLEVEVLNHGGPTGMFLSGTLEGTCTNAAVKP